MKNIFMKIHLFIITLACLTIGFGAGFYFGANKIKISDQSFALRGCEVTAATVENELEETRWELHNCHYEFEAFRDRTKKFIENIFKRE